MNSKTPIAPSNENAANKASFRYSALLLVVCASMFLPLPEWVCIALIFVLVATGVHLAASWRREARQFTNNRTRRAPVSNSKHPASRPNDDGHVGGADSSE